MIYMIVEYNGKLYKSITQLAKENNINPKTLFSRLRLGHSIYDAVNFADKIRPSKIQEPLEYKGKNYKDIKSLAKAYGVNYKTFYGRLVRGRTIEEAIEFKKKKTYTPKERIIFDGKSYDSHKELARSYGINYSNYHNRIKKGWSQSEALELVPRTVNRKGKAVTVNGKSFKSIKHFAIENGLEPSFVYSQRQRGRTLEEILSYREQYRVGRKIEYEGKIYNSITELAETHNISPKLLQNRLYRGYSLDKALRSEYLIGHRRDLSFFHDGIEYYSIKDFAERNALSKGTVYSKLKKGLTLSDILLDRDGRRHGDPVEYDGMIFRSKKQFAEAMGLSYEKVCAWLSNGRTAEEIVLSSKIKKCNQIEFCGETYDTKKELAEAYGIEPRRLYNKMFKGLSVEEIMNDILEEREDSSYKKRIWLELLEDESRNQNGNYDLLKELGLTDNIEKTEIDELEEHQQQKWMFIK